MAKVTSVVHSATQRAVPLRERARCRARSMMNSAPSSGRKVTTERIGQIASVHPCTANMNQVMKAAAPISMAKA